MGKCISSRECLTLYRDLFLIVAVMDYILELTSSSLVKVGSWRISDPDFTDDTYFLEESAQAATKNIDKKAEEVEFDKKNWLLTG